MTEVLLTLSVACFIFAAWLVWRGWEPAKSTETRFSGPPDGSDRVPWLTPHENVKARQRAALAKLADAGQEWDAAPVYDDQAHRRWDGSVLPPSDAWAVSCTINPLTRETLGLPPIEGSGLSRLARRDATAHDWDGWHDWRIRQQGRDDEAGTPHQQGETE